MNHKQTISGFMIGTMGGIGGSLAGVGGGFVIIPMLSSTQKILHTGLTQHAAHGTSLFAITAASFAGATSYATSNKGAVNFESAFCITICAMMTARLGALYSTKLSHNTLKRVLGVYLMGVSPIVPMKPYLTEWIDRKKNRSSKFVQNNYFEFFDSIPTRAKDAIVSGGIGLGSGFLAGLLGGGGGAIIVPALALFTSMDHYNALGTSLAAMVLPAGVGAMTHYKNGNVNMRIAPALAIGCLFGAYTGGKAGVSIDEDKMKFGFSGLMFGLGVKALTKH